ncbi:MAG TPA: metallophosphoesterase [bacterium]|nr:metallophosphoesterase [bacterium]HQO34190.1 metallophosphoesterase [bacterium]HQP98676.1 metallophosphoesterase [bacterium]
MIWLILVIPAAGIVLWAMLYERLNYRLRERSIALPFPGPERLTILHLSDLHLVPRCRRLIAFLRSLRGVEADLVLYTGDFLEDPKDAPLLEEALSGIVGRYGSFAVFGNHDYYRYVWTEVFGKFPHAVNRMQDITEPRETLEKMGIRCLFNRSCIVDCGGYPIRIVGIDDPYLEKDDIERALADVEQDETVIALVHSPGVYRELADRKVALILSGHTHGGQLRLPWLGALVTRSPIPKRMAMGISQIGNTTLFVSPGLGVTPRLPFRFLSPPEASILQVTFQPHTRD